MVHRKYITEYSRTSYVGAIKNAATKMQFSTEMQHVQHFREPCYLWCCHGKSLIIYRIHGYTNFLQITKFQRSRHFCPGFIILQSCSVAQNHTFSALKYVNVEHVPKIWSFFLGQIYSSSLWYQKTRRVFFLVFLWKILKVGYSWFSFLYIKYTVSSLMLTVCFQSMLKIFHSQ